MITGSAPLVAVATMRPQVRPCNLPAAEPIIWRGRRRSPELLPPVCTWLIFSTPVVLLQRHVTSKPTQRGQAFEGRLQLEPDHSLGGVRPHVFVMIEDQQAVLVTGTTDLAK